MEVSNIKADGPIPKPVTFINTFKTHSNQVARRDQETIKFMNGKLYLKEGTTYLVTISMNPSQRIPLFLVPKG